MSGVPTIPQYYHQLMARGLEVISDDVWDNSATADIVVTPSSTQAILVREICWVADDTFALGSGDKIIVSPWGNNGGTTYDITSFEHLIAMSEYTPPSTGATTPLHRGVLEFKPFIILKSTSTPVDEFKLEYSGVSGIGGTNYIHLVVKGHTIDVADLGLGV